MEDEIPMRGKIGQDPMIIDVPYGSDTRSMSSSGDESSGPETPPSSSNEHRGSQYSWKPGRRTDVPVDGKLNASRPSQQPSRADLNEFDNRGRKAMPKLDTDLAQSNPNAERPPQLERERSPYVSGPQDRKLKGDRFSGEHLLSPDIRSLRTVLSQSGRSHSHYDHRAAEPQPKHTRDSPMRPTPPPLGRHASANDPRTTKAANNQELVSSPDDPRRSQRPTMGSQRTQSHQTPQIVEVHDSGRPSHVHDNPRQSVRPSLEGRRSTIECPEKLPHTGRVRSKSKSHHGHSSEPDSEAARINGTPSQLSPQTPSKHPNGYFSEAKQDPRRPSSRRPDPRRSLTTADPDAPAVNLRSLVSGEGIHQILNATALNAALNKDPALARRASPRPSPRPSPGVSPLASPDASPTGSPYASPPRTPPNGHRANPVISLKRNSPASRPSSPLSSHSSTLGADPGTGPHSIDPSDRHRLPPLKSRHTTPLVSPPVDQPKENLAPGIVVRSPSPLPAKHGKSFSPESGELHNTHSKAGSIAPRDSPSPSTLRPAGVSERRRSASSADVRPQLTVNPAPFLQPSELPSSPGSRSRGTSPGLMSRSDRYKPAYLDTSSPTVGSSSSRPEPNPPAQRSRSYAFSPISPGLRSHSALPAPLVSSRPRATSSAPAPVVIAQPLKPLPSLPICPRPKRVAGYNDWYTLQHNTAFAICPDCRENVFGANSERYLMPKSMSSSRKTQCDLNNPWIRLSCLLRGPDLNILGALSEVTSKEKECPEDYDEPRDWYRLEDPENNKHISNFNACPQCVHSLEVLFPSWRDVFYRSHSSHTHNHELKERQCSLRVSRLRLGDYLDMIVASAQEAEKSRRKPNTEPVAKLAKQLAAITECPKDRMLPQKSWHVHAHMPEFTICQECYEEVIYPLAKGGSTIAANFDKQPQKFPNPTVEACCQLYSQRMRKVFEEACDDDDWEHLRHTAMKRHMLQQDILGTLVESSQYPVDDEIKERLGKLLEEWKKKE